jgi:antitoxin component YwqK of YwqJK toxin-antitoxin module
MKTNIIEFYHDWRKYFVEIDSNNRIIKMTISNLKSTKISKICEYNKNGKLMKETIYYSDGIIGHINEYNENENEKLVKRILYSPNGKTIWEIEKYDENENQITSTYYRNDGTIEKIDEYDRNGRDIIKATHYNPDGTIDYIDDYDDDDDDYDDDDYNDDDDDGDDK